MSNFDNYNLDNFDSSEGIAESLRERKRNDAYVLDDSPEGEPSMNNERPLYNEEDLPNDTSLYAPPQADDEYSLEDVEDNDEYADIYDVEEDPEWEDNSSTNYASAVRSGKSQEESNTVSRQALSPLAVMFKTMFTPVEGWKSLKRSRIPADMFASRCFYPLLAIASLSEFADMFYEAHIGIVDMIVRSLIVFISFFFGYFSALTLSTLTLSSIKDNMKSSLGKDFIMLSMSTLAIFYTLFNLLPMIGPALVFLPIWTVYMIYRGARILRAPREKESMVVVVISTLVIGMPILWSWVFTELIPLSQ